MRKAVLRGGRAFTLIELLVVVAIIALLISILLPSLGQARRSARAQIDKSNMRSLSQSALTYCTEYGVYPPSVTNYAQSANPTTKALRSKAGKDWLGIGDYSGVATFGDPNNPYDDKPEGFTAAPTLGLLFKTIRNEKVFLCPDDKKGGYVLEDELYGGGGNGLFSYTMFAQLGMRAPEKIIPRFADKTAGASRGSSPVLQRLKPPPLSQVPLFVEEHPEGINPQLPGGGFRDCHAEGNFNTSIDKVISRHPGGGKREGRRGTSGTITEFYQNTTHIAFADGHVEVVKVNFGFGLGDVQPTPSNPTPRRAIPHNAEGLLWYYGLEYREEDSATGEVFVVQAQ